MNLAAMALGGAGAAASSSTPLASVGASSGGGWLSSVLGSFKVPTFDLGAILSSGLKAATDFARIDADRSVERARIASDQARDLARVRAAYAGVGAPSAGGALGFGGASDLLPYVGLGLLALLAVKMFGGR